MIFLAPLMLGLLALGVLIAILHVRRRRALVVPGLMLWKQVEAATSGARAVLQWPRPSVPLLLQLLTLLFVVLALAQPFWGANGDVAHWIYVLDNSASMQAQDGGRTRRDVADALIREHAGGEGAGARYSLIVAGAAARPELARQAMLPGLFDEALARVEPEEVGADWAGAARLVDALRSDDEVTQVVVISDVPPADFLAEDGKLRLATVPVGAIADNAAISARLAQPSGDNQAWSLSGEVRFTPEMRGTGVTIEFTPAGAGEPKVLDRFEITGGGVVAFSRPLQMPGAGVLTARLDADGAAFDDRVDFVVGAKPATRRVLHIGVPEQPIARLFEAIDGVTVSEAETLPADADDYDLVIVDGVEVDRAPRTNALWVGLGRLKGKPLPAALADARPTGWDLEHVLAKSVGWTNLHVNAAYELAAPGDGDVLVQAGDASLLSVGRVEDGYDIRLAFDPAESDWPEQPSFAVFGVNLMQMLGPLPGQVVARPCAVGSVCPVDAKVVGGSVRLRGDEVAPAVLMGAFTPLRAGVYEIERNGRTASIAVHPLMSDEGMLAVGEAAIGEMPERPFALWRWLVGGAVVVLLIEAVVAGRGSEGFLSRRALADGAVARRHRKVITLRAVALGLAILAWFNLPFWIYRNDQAVVAMVGPSDEPVDGAETIFVSDVSRLVPRDNGAFAGAGADAIRMAVAMLPPDRPGRVIVGEQGSGNLAMLGPDLATRSVPVDMLPMEPALAPDAVARLLAPEQVFAGDRFELSAIVRSNQAANADVVVSDAQGEVWRETVQLAPGSNRFAVPVSAVAPGAQAYRMSVDVPGDARPANNDDGAVVDAILPGRIAVVSGQSGQGAAFAAMLEGQGFDVDLIAAANASETIDGWLSYSGIVLMNLPAIDLPIARQELIRSAVAEHGRGLMILGGANSFGPGGYLETPLDALSPISSRIPRDKPGVAIVFVLDRSSSMKQAVGPVTRLDIAKQATLAAIDLLNPESEVSVVTFDSAARLTVPLTSVTNKEFIERSVNQVSLGGGTALYRGLSTGFAQLRGVDASARHIVVMTDGQSQPADYSGLMASIRGEGITVSSVAIGEDSEIELIETLARDGGGLFHATTDFAALPSILSQEAMLLAGDPTETHSAQPYWVDREAQFLAGMGEAFPAIEGFVLATAKPEATMHAMVEDQFGEPVPLLASWRYGNGQVLAMTTDAAGDWTRSWQASEDYPRLFSQALRAFLPGNESADSRVIAEREGDIVQLRVTNAGGSALEAIGPDGSREPVALKASSDGSLAGSFVPRLPGEYRFALADGSAETGLYLAYPARLDWSRSKGDLPKLVAATGGRVLASRNDLQLPDAGRWAMVPFGLVWLGLALLIFLAELALRYTDIFNRFGRPARVQPTG
ncbi:VWA domain-containing protein [Devosia sp. D6-9]|nr:VWA domain-containing protein [Devosia sp. D6-9]